MELKPLDSNSLIRYCKELAACLAVDWANAFGKDANGPLVWQTASKSTWEEMMKELAEAKIAFRTNFKFVGGGLHSDTQRRHVISYPVTNHGLDRLGNNARLANQIRFKVEKTTTGTYRAIIFHMPCRAPDDSFLEKLSSQNQKLFKDYEKTVWPEIHKILDSKAARLK
jgi:CRISPR-associated protein Cmr1